MICNRFDTQETANRGLKVQAAMQTEMIVEEGLSGICRGRCHIWGSGETKEAVAFQVKEDALEPVPGVEQAKTATLEHFELIVQAFHKTTVGAGNKEGSNRLPPVGEGFEKGIKTGEATPTLSLDPSR